MDRCLYYDHIAAHTGVKRDTCTIRGMKFMNMSSLKTHVLHFHLKETAHNVVIKHSCTLLTEILTDITVIIIKATFHLTYLMTGVGWGTADDLATRRLQG